MFQLSGLATRCTMYCFSLWLDHCPLFHRFLSPLSAVPLISLAGFGLYELGFPGVRVSLEILFFFLWLFPTS